VRYYDKLLLYDSHFEIDARRVVSSSSCVHDFRLRGTNRGNTKARANGAQYFRGTRVATARLSASVFLRSFMILQSGNRMIA